MVAKEGDYVIAVKGNQPAFRSRSQISSTIRFAIVIRLKPEQWRDNPSHAPAKPCNPARSAFIKWVVVKIMTKLVRTRTLPLRASGQLRNIGLEADQNYTYDAAGNVTTSGTRTFAYNTWGHIAAAKKGPTNRAIYRYNVFIQRISKVAGSVTSYYVNDDSGLALGE